MATEKRDVIFHEEYQKGFEQGKSMVPNHSNLMLAIHRAYIDCGLVYVEGGKVDSDKDADYIAGVINGFLDGQPKANYHDLTEVKNNTVSVVCCLGVAVLITPNWWFSPNQLGFGIFIGLITGGPLLYKLFLETKSPKE
jgi:hypothetical protein